MVRQQVLQAGYTGGIFAVDGHTCLRYVVRHFKRDSNVNATISRDFDVSLMFRTTQCGSDCKITCTKVITTR